MDLLKTGIGLVVIFGLIHILNKILGDDVKPSKEQEVKETADEDV